MEIEEIVVESPVAFFDCPEFLVDFPDMKSIDKVAAKCKAEVKARKIKMHRYPASIRALGIKERYTTPMVVAIGPYHHGRKELKEAEKMKHVAAYECIKGSTHLVEDMYRAVVPEALGVRRLYDKDVMAGIGDDDFVRMMFFDACFLVQYMSIMGHYDSPFMMEESLYSFFNTYSYEIFQDIMLLENQIPWPLVEAVIQFRPVNLENFIYTFKGCIRDRVPDEKPFRIEISDHPRPPHLLGLLRYYIVGRTKPMYEWMLDQKGSIFSSVSANELAKIGITLKANKSSELIHMGLKTKGLFLGELFLTPVILDDARVSCLVSMAALELCTTSNFQGENVRDEDSAVCSYLLLLSTLVAREEDVQKLRTQHILEGAGLTNTEVLMFLTKLHGIRLGTSFVRILVNIANYKREARTRTKLYELYYGNKPTIAKVASVIVGTAGIIGTIIGVIKNLKTIDKS